MALKRPYELYKQIREELKPRINKLESEVEALKLENERQQAENDAVVDEIISEHEAATEELESRITSLKKENNSQRERLNKRELKKLAIEYETQEQAYHKDQNTWFKYALLGFVSIVATVLWAHLTTVPSEPLTDRIDRYIINVILITFLVFCLKQYSTYKDLRIDYANRKTIAQSYFNILDSSEDAVIKEKFLDASADILVSTTHVNNESHTIPEKLLDSITEIAKNLSKKVN